MKRIVGTMMAVLVLTLALTGCFKMQVGVQVNQDESGTFSISMGMAEEALVLLDNSLEDLQEEMLADMENEDRQYEITAWSEDEYEWVQASTEFEDLAELNGLMAETPFFESFNLSTSATFFSKEFTLDAELLPIEEVFRSDLDGAALDELGMDYGDLFDFEILVDLPGAIRETNGRELEEGGILWELEADADPALYAQTSGMDLDFSDPVPWLVGGGILLVCCSGILLAIILPVSLAARNKKKRQEAEA